MSQENVEIVRRHFEARNRRDLMTLLALWRSDAEIDWSQSRGPLKGVYRGHRELETFWNEFWSTFEEVQVEAHGFTEIGSEVVVPNTAHLHGREGIEVVGEEHVRVHGRERADHSPATVPRASRGPRSRGALGARRSRRLLSLRDTARCDFLVRTSRFPRGSASWLCSQLRSRFCSLFVATGCGRWSSGCLVLRRWASMPLFAWAGS